MVSYIVNNVDSKFTVHGDIPGHTAPGGGSIPLEICVTVQKPDIVIIDKQKKEIHLFELTSPCEENIEYWHQEKKLKNIHTSLLIVQDTNVLYNVLKCQQRVLSTPEITLHRKHSTSF